LAVAEALRVAIVTDAFPPGIGGVENHTVNLARELARLGHEVTVVTHREVKAAFADCRLQIADCGAEGEGAGQRGGEDRSTIDNRQSRIGVRVVRLDGGVLVYRDHDIAVDPALLAGFGRLLDGERFDIVHGQSEASMLVYGGLWLARRRGIATVLTRHSMLGMKPPVARPLVHGLTRLLLPLADGVIAVSEDCAAETAWFRGPSRVIPNGVDTARFAPTVEARRVERAARGWDEGDVVLGYAGRLHRKKGVLALADAFEGVRRECPEARLVFAGPGPLRDQVARRAAEPGSGISLVDPLDEPGVARFLCGLDVFAFPSLGEAFGIAVLEAMACALPVVALERWGVRRLVRHGRTGLLCREPGELAGRLVELCRDPGLRQRLGRAGREEVLGRYQWPDVAAQTAEFYRELTAPRA
jgi:glycosyltransferase involved in cell wall biosynthesis